MQQITENDSLKDVKPLSNFPVSLLVGGRIVLYSAFNYNVYRTLLPTSAELPLISCLMVTKQRFRQAQCAIACFQNQTYENKELVIIDNDAEDNNLESYIKDLHTERISYLREKSENKTIGELRNLAVERAFGKYVCQWDDDDLTDPMRLEMQMAAIQILNADASCMQRWLMWWPHLQRLAISRSRVWEGSLLCLKEKLGSYPAQRHGEDTFVMDKVLQNFRVALLNYPQLYIYVIHQQNTWNVEHFENHWKSASETYERERYKTIIQELANRLPLEKYLEIMEFSVNPLSLASALSFQPFFDSLGFNESSGNYMKTNKLDFLGKYQIGEGILHDLSYYNSPTGYYPSNGSPKNQWNGTWNNGINSRQDFLNSPKKQEIAIRQEAGLNWFRINYYLTADSKQNSKIPLADTNYSLIRGYLGHGLRQNSQITITTSGLLAAAHLVGPETVAHFLDGTRITTPVNQNGIPIDEMGTPVTDYMQDKRVISNGRKGLGGYTTPFDTLNNPSQNLSLTEVGAYGTYQWSENNSFYPFFTVK